MKSLLNGISTSQIITEPFPHLVVENVLDTDVYDQLLSEFPPLEYFTLGKRYPGNTKLQHSAHVSLRGTDLSPLWRELTQAHLTTDSFREMVRLMRPHLLEEFPDFEERFEELDQLRVGTRHADRCDIMLDAQVSIHTPTYDEPKMERGPHLKMLEKPFVGFLTLRSELDQSTGGEWEVFSIKRGFEPSFGPKQVTDYEYLRLEKAIPIRNNTLIFFLNTPRSIQGWGLRSVTDQPLMYFNFIASVKEPLFSVPQKSPVRSSPWSWFNRFSKPAA